MKETRKVVPGEEVAEVEEYIPAEGTYEEDGKVLAALYGELELDTEEKTAVVRAKNPMTNLHLGDLVFCTVSDVRASMAICEVISVEGKKRELTGDTNGTIHVSKMSAEYVQDATREMRPSDIIRAKVIQVRPSIQLTTAGPHLGVIKALCRKCRRPLVRVDKGLYCNNCERPDYRKLSDDYAAVEF
ncbi:MAG: exosome complex RNA-binding protein Csl4 [Euryarchaeota archaeon]|nr:exosome complex RNA-binding protein Csl4 [Euryarchaeota archaeon]